jgi:hypothetical protein
VGEDGATRGRAKTGERGDRRDDEGRFSIHPFEIKVIGPHNPIAGDLAAHQSVRLTRTPEAASSHDTQSDSHFRGNK